MRTGMKFIFAIVSAFLMLASASVYAQDVSKQRNKKAQLEKEITLLDKQIAGIKEQSASATTRLEMLRQNIANRKELIAESEALIKTYNDSIALKNKEILVLQNEIDTLVYYYTRLVSNAYKYRDSKVWYLYVFASDNLGQAFRRAAYFRNISGQIRRNAEAIREKEAELEVQKGALGKIRAVVVAEKNALVKELDGLRADEKEADNLIKQLKADSKAIEKQIAAKRKEVEALNREIQRKIEEAKRASSKNSSSKKADPAVDRLSGEFESNKGKLPWPADGAVVAKFGKRFHPVHKNLELPSNDGIDMAVEHGQAVTCIFEGVVTDVFLMPSYGQCVMVQHGNSYFTFYCRLENVAVKKGDKVTTGQTLGYVGSLNGTSQLHFEIWKNQAPQDPANWLRE